MQHSHKSGASLVGRGNPLARRFLVAFFCFCSGRARRHLVDRPLSVIDTHSEHFPLQTYLYAICPRAHGFPVLYLARPLFFAIFLRTQDPALNSYAHPALADPAMLQNLRTARPLYHLFSSQVGWLSLPTIDDSLHLWNDLYVVQVCPSISQWLRKFLRA